MKALWLEWRIAYYRAALRQISPMHPDVPEIVVRLNRLTSERTQQPLTH
jgi:hypothetical protein